MLEIYNHKKVFITGNTGFKGSWLAAFFDHLGVMHEGYALAPDTTPNHFGLLQQAQSFTEANILDTGTLEAAVNKAQPDIIFHLAAQALVRTSYTDPLNTYQTNVIGTLNVLEAARKCSSVKAVVLITTDKVYDNKEQETAYIETDELGGYDMYSSSKACCEILIRSYRNSFLNISDYKTKHHLLLASARAGNVIGGGDWSKDRLLPDIAVATSKNQKVQIRNPRSVRPWQHVLDCLYGYVLLGAKLLNEETAFAEAWNFSPYSHEAKTVEEIAAIARQSWQEVRIEFGRAQDNFHEAGLLILNNSKSIARLGWKPAWNTAEAVDKTISWYKDYYTSGKVSTAEQVKQYMDKINAQ
ncbi:CDP-glucose 4,6-dehydratase [Ferruginibacter sp. HRS2-29]|uniref:CDP-glucose 4,6-dehydratase n=1 Tax=Ferruginibacter sp. HRS2-29 TaxID=2487334 RepID=UPI0020CB6B1E|nr:CDP-glucose 4,6-dehydratase [Ferruginibacter sp. HRS2-29]